MSETGPSLAFEVLLYQNKDLYGEQSHVLPVWLRTGLM